MSLKFFANRPLAISILTAMLIVAFEAPAWINIFSFFLISYKFLSENSSLKKISRKLTAFLSIALMAEVIVQYGTLLNQEASTTLLLGLTSLKIMDFENSRDLKFVFLLGFIILAIKPLYSIDFYWVFPILFCFFGLWAGLISRQHQQPYRFLFSLGLSAVPLTLVLFIVFPRVVMPWATTRTDKQGTIGFSDHMDPGKVAELAGTNSVAFRVRFSEPLEFLPKALYWRGAVLTESRGLKWLPPKFLAAEVDVEIPTGALKYEVLQEPDVRSYLFGLEKPIAIKSYSQKIFRSVGSVFRLQTPMTKMASYEGFSSLMAHESDSPQKEHLQIAVLSEKANSWVNRIKTKKLSIDDRLLELKNLFGDGSFSYSIRPGYYDDDDLDAFLFKRRVGFCEHFAGAYATLARALGIPSRVVVGYQGGVYNKFGDFWTISSRDAHAWVEIYSGSSWERVDPTQWIAPLRLELGAQAFFELSEEEQKAALEQIRNKPEQEIWKYWYDQTTNYAENLNYRWTTFILEFDRGSQSGLIQKLKSHLGWTMLGAIGFLMIIYFLAWLVRPQSDRPREIVVLFNQIFLWGESNNLARDPSETPLSYLKKMASRYPQLQDFLDRLAIAYEESTYRSAHIRPFSVHSFFKEWRRLKKVK